MEPSKSSPPADQKLHFLDYWRIIRIRKTVILAVFLLVVFTTTAVTFMLPKAYVSTVRIAVTKDVADIPTLGFVPTAGGFDPYFITTEFEKIKSRSVLYPVLTNRLFGGRNLLEIYGERFGQAGALTEPEAYEALKNQIDTRQTRNTSLIEIRVYSSAKDNPAEEAKIIANEIARVYKNTRLALQRERAQSGIAALGAELDTQDTKVTDAQEEVDRWKQEYQISDAMVAGVGVSMLEPETVRRLNAEQITARAQYSGLFELLKRLQELRQQGTDELRNAIATANYDAELGKLLQDLWSTEALLEKMRVSLGLENPEYRAMAAMAAGLEKRVDAKIDGMFEGLQVRVDATKRHLDSLTEDLEKAKAMDADMSAKYRPYVLAKRNLENAQKIRDAVYLRLLQEQVDLEIPRSAIVEVTDQAEASLRPFRPNVRLNIVLGIIVGLVVGVGLAFFIEYLDTSVKTIDDVERALQAPVLGVIPQNVGSLLEEGPDSAHAEAYRVLRTNVLFSRKDDTANTLTVVSGGAGEGKSTTIFNLATVFAHNNQRVLLVDSDLRRPSLHKILGVSNATGLTSVLLGQATIEQAIQTTELPTLNFLPSGKLPSSSLGILNSPQMKEFITEVKKRYDYVFFDSPPIMGVSDASILASMVDLTLLVIQYRKYPQAMTQRAKQMVEKVGGRLVGVLLNNINISQDSYYYYYSGYYYDYYSKRDSDEPAAKNNGQKDDAAASRRTRGADLKKKY